MTYNTSPTHRAICSTPIGRANSLSGRELTSISDRFGSPIRDAVRTLTHELSVKGYEGILDFFELRQTIGTTPSATHSVPETLAWVLVSIWLVAFATRSIEKGNGIRDAISWFFSDDFHDTLQDITEDHTAKSDQLLLTCHDPNSYLQLLPYVLDPLGPASRVRILRSGDNRATRESKREKGVYYTPVDVATYMVDEAIRPFLRETPFPQIYDPACGTGVFLRTSLHALRSAYPHISSQKLSSYLYGTDTDPLAIQGASFVLLADCIVYEQSLTSPIKTWLTLRKNLSCVDALRLDPESTPNNSSISHSGQAQPPSSIRTLTDVTSTEPTRLNLSQIFPHMYDTPLAIIGNPPYTRLGMRKDFHVLATQFATMAPRQTASSATFPLFIEQMIRLAPRTSAVGSMVVPLSIACNIGHQFAALRELIERTPGTWKFAFFDREPHALFGEDVKTRNSILFWKRTINDVSSRISSGPLYKWRSRERAMMFSSINFTPLVTPIRGGIPKLDGPNQSRAHYILSQRTARFCNLFTTITRVPLARSIHAEGNTVFVASTAYNFLNVFLTPSAETLPQKFALSEHPLHSLTFQSKKSALVGFALLSSHLAYWWWRATQDGFHVTARFLDELPFDANVFSDSTRSRLAYFGHTLWTLVSNQPTVSVNKGKASLAFSPAQFNRERRQIDKLLASSLGLDPNFNHELNQFVHNTITASFSQKNALRELNSEVINEQAP